MCREFQPASLAVMFLATAAVIALADEPGKARISDKPAAEDENNTSTGKSAEKPFWTPGATGGSSASANRQHRLTGSKLPVPTDAGQSRCGCPAAENNGRGEDRGVAQVGRFGLPGWLRHTRLPLWKGRLKASRSFAVLARPLVSKADPP